MTTQTMPAAGFELHGETTPIPQLVRSIWRSRSLIRLLARRDFYVRFRRPSFGLSWAIVVPLMQATVLAIVFSLVIRVRTPIPIVVFVLSGVLPWTFFASGLSSSSMSIAGGSGMASKVYFPRAVLPMVSIGSNLYGFIPGLAILIIVALAWRVPLGPRTLLLIPAVALLVLLTASFGLVFAAVHVYFRDVGFMIQASLTAWFYASAVIFPISLVPKGILRTIVLINPATGAIQFFRASMGAPQEGWVFSVVAAVVWSVVLLVVALFLYRRFDRVFVDRL